MNTLAILLSIMYVTILIGIGCIVKKMNAIEEEMIELHNHLVDGIDTCYSLTKNNLSDLRRKLDHLNDMLQSAQDSRDIIHMKFDHLQENLSDIMTGSNHKQQ